jgi:hypothetical protein
MNNVVTLHTDKRWRALVEYKSENGPISIEHFFEEIADLHVIIERGPDWNTLVRCVVTLNRPDGGTDQENLEKSVEYERHGS